MRRRRLWVVLAILGVASAGVVVIWNSLSEPPSVEPVEKSALGLAEVVRTDLVEVEEYSATLGRPDADPIVSQLGGVVTAVVETGEIIEAGRTLFEINEQPVFSMAGVIPAYRDLRPSEVPERVVSGAGGVVTSVVGEGVVVRSGDVLFEVDGDPVVVLEGEGAAYRDLRPSEVPERVVSGAGGVVTSVVGEGVVVRSGDVLFEVDGDPVVVLEGEGAAYRDLRPSEVPERVVSGAGGVVTSVVGEGVVVRSGDVLFEVDGDPVVVLEGEGAAYRDLRPSEVPERVVSGAGGVVTSVVGEGVVVRSGDVLFEVDGDPVVVLEGEGAAYRDLRPSEVPERVVSGAGGVVTSVVGEGVVVRSGDVLFEVDGDPVVVLEGSVPFYRRMALSEGSDAVGSPKAGRVSATPEIGSLIGFGDVLFELDDEPVAVMPGDIAQYRPLAVTNDPERIAAPSPGTVTWVPAEGLTLRYGEALFEINTTPVFFFVGDFPAYRDIRYLPDNEFRGEDVEQLEYTLSIMGYNKEHEVKVDRIFTYQTKEMVERWQEDVGIEEDGVVNLGEVVFLSGGQVLVTSVVAEKGDAVVAGEVVVEVAGSQFLSGDDVLQLEEGLAGLGFGGAGLVVDGVFDGATRLAVLEWQEAVGAEPDGVVDLGEVVFLSGAGGGALVTEVLAEDGDVVAVGGVVLEVASSQLLSGGDVLQLERGLLGLGFGGAGLVVDGVFDGATRLAVLEWQEAVGAEPDGVVDLGEVVFLLGAGGGVLVTSVVAEMRDVVAPGGVVLEVAGSGLLSGDDVLQLERGLLGLGFGGAGLVVDGVFDGATRLAVVEWQEAVGAEPDGVVELGEVVFMSGNMLVTSLVAEVGQQVAPGGVVLEVAGLELLSGGDVLQLEKGLLALGFGGAGLVVDGVFDGATRLAVVEWQEAVGAEPDGVVDLGEVVFLSGAGGGMLVTEVLAEDGDVVAVGGVVLEVAGSGLLSGGDVLQLERGLLGLGFGGAGLVVDGVFDSGTRLAVLEWQEAVGAEPDGVVDLGEVVFLLGAGGGVLVTSVVAEMRDVVAPGGVVLEVAGSGLLSGDDVLQLEQGLAGLGFGGAGLVVDGVFDSGTRLAVLEWQEAVGAEPDGVVDLGEVVFLSGAGGGVLVTSVVAELGRQVVPGGVVLEVAGAELLSGSDVLQLEKGLLGLGFGGAGLVVDGVFDGATRLAVLEWQEAVGAEPDGVVELGEVVFLPEPLLVTDLVRRVGQQVSPGGVVLEAAAASSVVTLDLPAADQGELEVGEQVTVELPDGTEVVATVTSVSGVASTLQNGETVFEVLIALDDPSAAQGLEEAPVKVKVVTDSAEQALAVPVTALLALAEGGYAVEAVDESGDTRLVGVETGLFADGLVEITTDALGPGDRVVVP